MLKRLVVVLAVAVMFSTAFGLLGAGHAQASTTQGNWPLSYTYYDWCFGENIAVEGNIHYTWNYTPDGSGGYHYMSHTNYAGVSGTGLSSGLKYTANGVGNYKFNAKAPWPYNYTSIYRFRWNQQGGGSEWYSGQFHYTVNANGDLTANFSDFDSNCNP
jgi:hypothetical protein